MVEPTNIEPSYLSAEWLIQDMEQKRKKAIEYLGQKWILHPQCKTRYDRGHHVLNNIKQMESQK